MHHHKSCAQCIQCNDSELFVLCLQAPNDERLKDAISELKEGPRELVDLYNEYACPWAQWGLALEMVEIANYSDAAYVCQLWDVYLRQVDSRVSFDAPIYDPACG
jgi:hypothetical protein